MEKVRKHPSPAPFSIRLTTQLRIITPPLRSGRRGALIHITFWDSENDRGALIHTKIFGNFWRGRLFTCSDIASLDPKPQFFSARFARQWVFLILPLVYRWFSLFWSTNFIWLRHLGQPLFLTGALIHSQNLRFENDRGALIHSKKSQIFDRGALIEGGVVILNWVVFKLQSTSTGKVLHTAPSELSSSGGDVFGPIQSATYLE